MSIKNLDLIKNSALFRKKYHAYVATYIKDLNISSAEFAYLKELMYNEGSIQDVLVQNTCMDKAAASRVMKSLENKNLIMRVKNKADKRSLNIYFTEEGKKLIPIINKILDDWYLELSNAMGSEKLDLLISLFTELNEKHP
ncbi:MarR family winged helix-turn-helix transcriptional regulator [Clostridium thermobutyricum]|uniref:HTH-type transcriptional regulator SarZ n=1 Tax=Clostridium thermobutyricum DSM 4928 TaxID=1121339 RepID=A0A1V4SYL0_9CLOT|nr:MarR family transcriptional regulator [Clostridium thermobutyricum]OPX49944.1 multidrug resistance operon repressor [Clostridium thermobutyricum DSM 4928]